MLFELDFVKYIFVLDLNFWVGDSVLWDVCLLCVCFILYDGYVKCVDDRKRELFWNEWVFVNVDFIMK